MGHCKAISGLIEIIKEHKGQRKQILLLSYNDLVIKYKGAVLGFLWAVIKPLFTLLILLFAFEVGIRSSSDVSGVPRYIFLLTGYIPWFYVQESILGGARSIRKNQQFVTKLTFPVSNIMTFTALSNFYVHLMLSVLMYIFLVFKGFGLSLFSLQYFYYSTLMFFFFLALSWATAPLSAFSKDFENLVSTVITGMFWLSGVFWNTYDIKTGWLRDLMLLNPINYFVNGYRKAFVYEIGIFNSNYTKETVIFYVEFLMIILVGAYYYKKLRKILPDVL